MTKLSLGAHPFLLGFDQLERLVERTAKSGNEGYPPYNIEQIGETAYRITLAVAGFAEDELSITLEDRQLVIRGRQIDDSAERVFLHRGIAARQFQRSFVLADGVEVAGAVLQNGLLHIALQRSVPDSVVRKIAITVATPDAGKGDMTNEHNATQLNAGRIVYIRPIAVADLPDDLRQKANGLVTLYAIGSETGERLALVRDRDLAFVVARQNDLTPVSVH